MMMLLQHANIGLPAEVTSVYCLNQQIHLVIWHVEMVRVSSLGVGTLVHFHLRASSGLRTYG